VFVFPKITGESPPASAPQVAVAPAAADAAVAIDAAEPTAVEAEPIEMDPMETSSGSAVPTPPPAHQQRPGRPVTASTPGPVTHPEAGSAETPAPAAPPDAAVDDTVENAPNNPSPSAGECDEVSCVLSKYDRPCCEKFKPKQGGIAPRTASGVPEELDKSMVRAGIEKVKPRVVTCGEHAATKGTVKIAVKVAPEGNVTAASVVTSPDPALGECVAGAIKNAVFGKSVNGGSFTYPFVF
jgi:hypothetical protein